MSSYRCYLLDGHGVVVATEDFDCSTEDEALSMAQELVQRAHASGLELWQRPRLLHAVRPAAT